MRAGLGVHWLIIVTLALAPLVAGAWQRVSLSSEEQIIAARVDAGNADGLALLEKVVNINSGTLNLAGVREVGGVFRTEFDRLGFKTQWVDQSSVQRGGHLVADHSGTGPRILLIGHLDTVFEPDSPFQKYERLDAKTARGPGIIDMKGGDVVIVQALKALEAAGLLTSMNVVVVLTGDEEEPGRPRSRAREALIAAARGADVAIGFEDGDGDPSHAIVSRRGTTSWELRVTGRSGHSSQVFSPEVGAGAIFEAARILTAFRERLGGEPHLDVQSGPDRRADDGGGRRGAVARNRVRQDQRRGGRSAGARRPAGADHRTAPPGSRHDAGHRRAVAAEYRSTITFDEGYPPLAPSEANERLLALYDRTSQDLGLGAVTAVSPDKAGAADVSFVAGEVTDDPRCGRPQGPRRPFAGETADLTTLPVQTKRAAVLLARIARQGIR